MQGDRAERRAVRVLQTDNDKARIAAGITVGDNVIVDAPSDLKDGERVKVKVTGNG